MIEHSKFGSCYIPQAAAVLTTHGQGVEPCLLSVEAKVGKVAYKLELPLGSRIYTTFHVSQLKRHVGKQSVQTALPILGLDGAKLKEPSHIIDRCMTRRGNQTIIEVLVEWTNIFPEDGEIDGKQWRDIKANRGKKH